MRFASIERSIIVTLVSSEAIVVSSASRAGGSAMSAIDILSAWSALMSTARVSAG